MMNGCHQGWPAGTIAGSRMKTPPIVSHKHFRAPSAFTPENLLREARRQKGLPAAAVPDVCILDPDGDIVRHLRGAGQAAHHPGWACYHTGSPQLSTRGP